MAVTKQCQSFATEESYKILDGTTVLETSRSFANNEKRMDEYCLPATTNSQYTFMMKDTYGSSGDSWANGAWVSIAGIYGNVVFKNFMIEKVEELFAFSLHYPVMKNVEWKMTSSSSSIAADWNTASFADGSWNAVTLGSAPAVSGTQYFRKTFSGIPDMAAYEYEMNYRYGIIAYINGAEVFRDHMTAGAVTTATASDGAYDAYEYHGVIRPAGEVTGTSNVLAVGLHFPTMDENAVEFDAFVAALASSTAKTDSTNCYIYPYEVTLSSSIASSPSSVFDYGKTSYYTVEEDDLPVTVTYELGGPRAHINGVRVWPYSYPTQSPGEFTWQGAMSSSGTYSTVVSATHVTYETSTFNVFYGYFFAKPYQSYRLTLNSAVSALHNPNQYAQETV